MPAHLHNSIYEQGGATGSVWETEVSRMTPATARMEGSETCDVVVIGGGLIGLSAAYHLAKEQKASVIVIEGAQPGWGSTSRGLGLFGLSPYAVYQHVDQLNGSSISTARLLASDKMSMDLLEKIALEEGIDMHRAGEGVLTLARSDSELNEISATAYRAGLSGETEMEMLARDSVVSTWMESPRIAGAVHTKLGGGVDPLVLANGLADACARMGVRIFTGTRVREVLEKRNQVAVRYRGGTLTAGAAVVATHLYTRGRSIPDLADRQLHMLFHGLATRPLTDPELLANGLKKPFIARIEDDLTGPTTIRVLPDRRIAMTATVSLEGDPQRASEARARLRGLLMALLPGLRDVPIAHSWRGLAARRDPRLPVVAPLSESARLIYAGGLEYDSVNLATLIGQIGAHVATGTGDLRDHAFVLDDRLPRIRFASFKQKMLGYKISQAEPVL
jgi:glycine/D-amino acid oxidase-like deaminating enzyme